MPHMPGVLYFIVKFAVCALQCKDAVSDPNLGFLQPVSFVVLWRRPFWFRRFHNLLLVGQPIL